MFTSGRPSMLSMTSRVRSVRPSTAWHRPRRPAQSTWLTLPPGAHSLWIFRLCPRPGSWQWNVSRIMKSASGLPAHPRLERYKKIANDLVKAFKLDDPCAMRLLRRYHPRLAGRPDTNDRNKITDAEIRKVGLSLADARFVI